MTSAYATSYDQTRDVSGDWKDFTIDEFNFQDVDGVVMLNLTLSAYERGASTDDAKLEEISFMFPLEILSESDYAIIEQTQKSNNIFGRDTVRRTKLAKKIFDIKTSHTSDSRQKGWNHCSKITDGDCTSIFAVYSGGRPITRVEVKLK